MSKQVVLFQVFTSLAERQREELKMSTVSDYHDDKMWQSIQVRYHVAGNSMLLRTLVPCDFDISSLRTSLST